MQYKRSSLALVLTFIIAAVTHADGAAGVPENLYTAQAISYPGAWAYQLGKSGIIIVEDQQLDDLTDPDKPVDLGLTGTPDVKSLRQICEGAKAAGHRTLILAFDHFFSQYRNGAKDGTRKYVPDEDAMVERIAKISKFAQEYGLGLELSLLSPLEIGRGYRAATNESGMWLHYRKGVRDATTGQYSVQLWRHTKWSNNKGTISVEDAGVRVFAFRERVMNGTPYNVVEAFLITEMVVDRSDVDVGVGANVANTGLTEAILGKEFASGVHDAIRGSVCC